VFIDRAGYLHPLASRSRDTARAGHPG
jgi:hypothetical protein